MAFQAFLQKTEGGLKVRGVCVGGRLTPGSKAEKGEQHREYPRCCSPFSALPGDARSSQGGGKPLWGHTHTYTHKTSQLSPYEQQTARPHPRAPHRGVGAAAVPLGLGGGWRRRRELGAGGCVWDGA